MTLRRWSRSEVEYGRSILNSGLQGVRDGREEFLVGKPLGRFLGQSVRNAVPSAAIGLCIGMLGGCPRDRRSSLGKLLVFGLIGGAIGFGASVAWESRRLTVRAAQGASRNISRVRDERWMKKHSIAYA
jgi:hypothetical protein